MRPRKVFLVAAFALALLVEMGARPAAACSCTRHGRMVWPRADSTNVPTDVTLVMRVSSLDLEAPTFTLVDEFGADVPLEWVRTLDGKNPCRYGNYVFLRPQIELTPGMRYTATATLPPPSGFGGEALVSPASFSAGEDKRGEGSAPDIQLQLFQEVIGPPDGPLLQLFASAEVNEAVFARVIGAAGATVAPLGALAAPTVTPLGVPLGKVPCADVELVDATGHTFRTERLCVPERCIHGNGLVVDTCEVNPGGRPWEEWMQRSQPCGSSDDGCSVATPARDPSAHTAIAISSVIAAVALTLSGLRARDKRARKRQE